MNDSIALKLAKNLPTTRYHVGPIYSNLAIVKFSISVIFYCSKQYFLFVLWPSDTWPSKHPDLSKNFFKEAGVTYFFMVSGERAGLKGDAVFVDTFKQVQSVG